jgi:hypothetical protein
MRQNVATWRSEPCQRHVFPRESVLSRQGALGAIQDTPLELEVSDGGRAVLN